MAKHKINLNSIFWETTYKLTN